MADQVLNFGVIGIGSGARGLLKAFREQPGYKVTAACDVRKDALDRFAAEWGAETFTDVDDFCKNAKVDAVWVATPNHFHAPHVIAVANARKHVIVSKPMAISLDECKAMIDAADRNGVRLIAGHAQGILPGVRKMAELVQSGQYGELGMVHSWNYTPWIYRPRMPEELDVKTGGGIVFRQSPHHIDIVRLVAGGMVRSVRAMTKVLDPSRPVPGVMTVYLEFEDGTPSTIVYDGYGHFDSAELTHGAVGRRTEALVTAGMSKEQEEALKEGRRFTTADRETPAAAMPGGGGGGGDGDGGGLSPFGLTIASCAKAVIRQSPTGLILYKSGEREDLPLKGEPRGWAELTELYQHLVHGSPIIHDGRWGLATQEVTMAIIESAETRKEVMMQYQVPLPKDTFAAYVGTSYPG